MRSAVQFGAGAIGRGFMAQLFHEAGYHVTFVEVNDATISAINSHREYTVHIVGDGAQDIRIDDIDVIDGRNSDEVARAVANCDVMCTAVGANIIPIISVSIAKGLGLRDELSGSPLNIVICENLHDAADVMRNCVKTHLPQDRVEAIIAKTGFVQAVVSRMAPPPEPKLGQNPLDVSVESYKRLPIDQKALVDYWDAIANIDPIDNFAAEIDRKLYTHNCGHAVLGYMGFLKNYEFGYEALVDDEISTLLRLVLTNTGNALIQKHGFSEQNQRDYESDLIRRFANRDLGDTCYRLGRDPIRKLALDDRLVGAARLCEEFDIDTTPLSHVIAAALQFTSSDDPISIKLQNKIHENGYESTIQRICGISPTEQLGRQILTAISESAPL